MIEAGAVGATFEIVDLASAVLLKISTAFEDLDAVIKQTKEALATFRLPPSVNAALKTLNESLGALPASADKAMLGVSGAFTKMDASILATQERVKALNAEIAASTRIPGAAALAGGSGGRGSWPASRWRPQWRRLRP